MPALHVGIQVGAAGHVHPLGARVGFHRERFLERPRLQVGEGWKSEHQGFAAVAVLCRPLPPSTALPSPPSHGVATRIGSGQGISGKVLGPTRPSSPLAFARRALNTFSGVIGTSSMRTPTASYTAFATAGGAGGNGPRPHSLAPKGALGSGASIT